MNLNFLSNIKKNFQILNQRYLSEVVIGTFILIFTLFILVFQKDLGIDIQNIITLLAVIVAFSIGMLSSINTKKTLQQSEKNLNIQLKYNLKMESLYELEMKLIKEKFDLKGLRKIMDSNFVIYLPENTKILINKSINELYKFDINNNPDPPRDLTDWEQTAVDEYEEERLEKIEKMDPYTRFEHDYNNLKFEIECSIMENIKENYSTDPSDLD